MNGIEITLESIKKEFDDARNKYKIEIDNVEQLYTSQITTLTKQRQLKIETFTKEFMDECNKIQNKFSNLLQKKMMDISTQSNDIIIEMENKLNELKTTTQNVNNNNSNNNNQYNMINVNNNSVDLHEKSIEINPNDVEQQSQQSIARKEYDNNTNTERPWLCIDCGDRFKTKATLRTHRIIHTNIKRYECEYCSKRFARS